MRKLLTAILVLAAMISPRSAEAGLYRPFFIWSSSIINDQDGQPLEGDNPLDPEAPGIPGDLLQVLSTGDDGIISPPDVDGNPTGDDIVITTTTIGVGIPWGYSFPGQFCYLFGQPLVETEPDIYVRAFNASTLENAYFYGDSTEFAAQSTNSEDFDVSSLNLSNTGIQFKATVIPTPSPTATPSPSSTPTSTPTPEIIPPTPERTPSPSATPSILPSSSPTPSIGITPSPSPTPEYCGVALELADLEGLSITSLRAFDPDGWSWDLATAALPANSYGTIADNANLFLDGASYSAQPAVLRISSGSEEVAILEGDYLEAIYDGSQIINIYPPALSGPIDVYYYIGEDGSTYCDRWLCELAKAPPSPTPSTTPTMIPTATPTAPLVPTFTPTPIPTATPIPSATPSASPTPCYSNWYLAAGGTLINGYEFEEFVSILNPNDIEAPIEIISLDNQGVIDRDTMMIPAQSRYTVTLEELVEGTRGEMNPSVSLIVSDLSDNGIMVERSMYWNAGGIEWGGGHNSIASHSAADTWSLPEGATHSFDEYIHVVNPGGRWSEDTAVVRVTFVNELGSSWEVNRDMPPLTNWTVYVNDVVGSQPNVSTLVEVLNGAGVSVDRTMYWDGTGYEGAYVPWIGGHCSIGISESSTIWYVPEGATHMFDDYVLVTNPSRVQDADIQVKLLGPNGVLKEFEKVLAPMHRYTIYVNREVGWQQPHVSAVVESVPRPAPAPSPHSATYITVERSMYWKPFVNTSWGGGHNSIGSVSTAPTWYFAEGASSGFDEYILLANPDSETSSQVRLTFYFEDQSPVEFYETVDPDSRKSIYVNRLVKSQALSCRVEVLEGSPEIIAERAMYWHSVNPLITWIAGHSSIGIPRLNQ